jgi:anti-anti-sigma factor
VRDALERAAVDLEVVAERRSAVVETFQRSMLPQSLPDLADIELAARYIPASVEVDVGGDWYDAVALPDGRLAVAIGDVAGHGTQAAATMAQLRMATRAYALKGLSPCEALEQLNRVAHGRLGDVMATMLYVVMDADTGDYIFASAGHLPPLEIPSSDRARFLEGGLAAPVGSAPFVGYRESGGTLAPGATLLLYTDGLVERRGRHIDDGLSRALESGTIRHVLDLSHTMFIDSVGIHMLFALAASLRTRRQELRIAVPDASSVARVLRLTDVPSLIPMFADVEEALASKDDFNF